MRIGAGRLWTRQPPTTRIPIVLAIARHGARLVTVGDIMEFDLSGEPSTARTPDLRRTIYFTVKFTRRDRT